MRFSSICPCSGKRDNQSPQGGTTKRSSQVFPNPCGPCGWSIVEGTVTFIIFEMIVTLLGLIFLAVVATNTIEIEEKRYVANLDSIAIDSIVYGTYIVLQVFMYWFGWKKRRVQMCWIWIVFAAFTLIFEIIEIILQLITISIWISMVHSYRLYGIWIVYEFARWIKRGERPEYPLNITFYSTPSEAYTPSKIKGNQADPVVNSATPKKDGLVSIQMTDDKNDDGAFRTILGPPPQDKETRPPLISSEAKEKE
ncbi:hypothetical protein Ocin01_04715 [Orchesella cincta]|uniref:Uncharacterized protein n=1 Tax=Orchesella cincta TaxID=48709 RepID=A0A1D2NAH0_ORCCI|nr:hypothetical protein Ocin01_04715 [Orchesella cincta]